MQCHVVSCVTIMPVNIFCLRLTNEEIYYFEVSLLYLHWQ